jgi:rare lipoprotein A
VVCALSLVSCAGDQQAPATPHYELGAAYEAGGVWFYPRASYNAVQTGLATVFGADHRPVTADGECFDASTLAVAHQTLQLPAIARVTNLENGRQVVVRVNERGPSTASRLIAVTRRTAALLGFPPSGVARVRLEVLPAESRAAIEALGGAPEDRLEIAAAPVGAVQEVSLSVRGGPPGAGLGTAAPIAAPLANPPLVTPLARLPERITLVPPQPGSLWVQMDSFGRYEFAARQQARVAALGPKIERFGSGRAETYQVRIGPLATVTQADVTLDRVIRAGIEDARIVIE